MGKVLLCGTVSTFYVGNVLLCGLVFPHTDNGKLEARLRGIVTSRDVDFMGEECLDRPLSDVSGGVMGVRLE